MQWPQSSGIMVCSAGQLPITVTNTRGHQLTMEKGLSRLIVLEVPVHNQLLLGL